MKAGPFGSAVLAGLLIALLATLAGILALLPRLVGLAALLRLLGLVCHVVRSSGRSCLTSKLNESSFVPAHLK